MVDGWGRIPVVVGVLATLFGRSGCPFSQGTLAPTLPTGASNDLALGVSIVAIPSHRLIAAPEETDGPAQLIVAHARIENSSTDTFLFNPANVTLTFADGAGGRALDRQRAEVLIERLDITPTDACLIEYRELRARIREPVVQEQLKRQVIAGLLDEMPLGNGAISGHLLLDAQRRLSSLEGAVLRVDLVRISDGATLHQIYRFSGANLLTATDQP